MNNKILYEKLFKSCKNGNIEAVKFLIKKGLNINYKNKEGKTALFYACKNKNFDVAKYLIENGADYTETLFYFYDNLEIIKFLVEETKININVKDANNLGKTILFNACEIGNIELIKYLTEHGADVNAKCKDGIPVLWDTLIVRICDNDNNLEIVKCLLEHGANIDDDILFTACLTKKLELVKYLIQEKKLNVNTKNHEGQTVLSFVKEFGSKNIFEYLKSIGAKE